MRFQLYVRTKKEADLLQKHTILNKTNCKIHILSTLDKTTIPQWFAECHAPMLADTKEEVFYHGTSVEEALRSKYNQLNKMFREGDELDDEEDS
jgi:hypothetical protein